MDFSSDWEGLSCVDAPAKTPSRAMQSLLRSGEGQRIGECCQNRFNSLPGERQVQPASPTCGRRLLQRGIGPFHHHRRSHWRNEAALALKCPGMFHSKVTARGRGTFFRRQTNLAEKSILETHQKFIASSHVGWFRRSLRCERLPNAELAG